MTRSLDRPIFIVGCNRSGTTLLHRTLAEHPDLWTHPRYDENEELFRAIFPADGPDGDAVAPDADLEPARRLSKELYRSSHNKEFVNRWPSLRWIPNRLFQRPLSRLYRRPPIRYVDKTPSNCFRAGYLARGFPDAFFVFLVRRGEDVISSLMDGWKRWDGGEYTGEDWHYLRPPGWRDMLGEPLVEVCLFQWRESNACARRQLGSECPERHLLVRYDELTRDPAETFREICEFADLAWTRHFESVVQANQSRVYQHRGEPPEEEKWKRLHGEEIESVRDRIRPVNRWFYEAADGTPESVP